VDDLQPNYITNLKKKRKKRGKIKTCPEVRNNETKNCELGFQFGSHKHKKG
jgi:hypothetical protein